MCQASRSCQCEASLACAELIHGVEVDACVLLALAPAEEDNACHGRRHSSLQCAHRQLCYLLRAGGLGINACAAKMKMWAVLMLWGQEPPRLWGTMLQGLPNIPSRVCIT